MSLPIEDEEWRPVPGSEGIYWASSLGRIISFKRPKPVELKPRPNKRGYLIVHLYGHPELNRKQGKHQIIAATFCDREPGQDEVRHLDDNPQNNRADNLAWGTHAENMWDAVRNGVHPHAKKTHCKRGHEFTPENTGRYRTKRGRFCLQCHRAPKPKERADCPQCGATLLRKTLTSHRRRLHPDAAVPVSHRRAS